MKPLLTRSAALVLAARLLVTTASAAGFDYTDHGTRAIGMGGAHAGLPDDGTAPYYNPAALTAIPERLTLTLDNHFTWQHARFQRTDASGNRAGPEVENRAGVFLTPFLAATARLGDRFAVALSAFGPSAVGTLEYPPVPFGTPTSQMDRYAPQRYALVERHVFIAYPGVSVAAKVTDWLAVGATVQLAYGSFKFTQNIAGANGDQKVDVDTRGVSSVTGILGATVRVVEGLHVGASWRPRFDFETDGTIKVGPYNDLQLRQEGDRITFKVPFPDVFRLGVDWRSGPARVAADFDYETWGRVDRFTLEAREPIRFVLNTTGGESVLEFGDRQYLERGWEDAWAIRLGGEYTFPLGRLALTPRLGAFYESSAIPDDRLDVSFPNWERYAATAGVSATYGRWALAVAYAHLFQPDKEVRNSTYLANIAPDLPAGSAPVIGNGNYRGAYDVLSVGLRAALDGP